MSELVIPQPRELGVLGDLTGAARRVLLILATVDLALLTLFVANEIAGFNTQILNLDDEANLPAWLGSLQFAAAGVCAALAGLGEEGRRQLAWWVLAAVFLFLSADELATIHEKAAGHVEAFWPEGIPKTPVLYSPLLAATVAAVVLIAAEVRRVLGTTRPLFVALALLVLALALDAADVQTFDVSSPRLRPFIVLEEATELLGTALLIAVLLSVFLRKWIVAPRGSSDP